MDKNKIGNFLIELRKEKNISQQDLSDKLNISRESISKWERGINLPSTDILINIADIFDLTLDELVKGERNNKNFLQKNAYLISLGMIIFLSLIALIINTKASHIYKLEGNSPNFTLKNSLIIFNDNSFILKPGFIYTDKEVLKYELCYYDGKNEIVLLKTNDLSELATGYSSRKRLENNIYLKIIYQDKNEVKEEIMDLKLNNVEKTKENNDLYMLGKTNYSMQVDERSLLNYFKDNFMYDNYFKKFYCRDKNIDITYLVKDKILIIDLLNKNTIKSFEYNLYSDLLKLTIKEKGKESKLQFSYEINSNICMYGDCNNNDIDFFKRYLSKFSS